MQDKEIHNHSNIWRHHFPRHHLLAACGISLAVTFMLSILPDSVIAYRTIETTENPPATIAATEDLKKITAVAPPSQAISTEGVDPWLHLTVRRGDTLSSLLQKAGLDLNSIHEITSGSKNAKELAELDLGDELDLLMQDGKATELRLHRSKLESLAVTLEGDKYQARKITRTPEIRFGFAAGTIDSSLFTAGQKAGLNDQITLKLADIFAYDIDFAQDIQQGDRFSVVYEQLFLDGEKIGDGKILAAEFINGEKTYRGILYTNQKGATNYYTPDGELMRKQFLRTPLDFARITSYFSLNRMHPILHKLRAHKGIDYAAPQGTPIRSAGDGTVVFAGTRNGFGNVVMIQHGSAYTTVYGHMQKISVRNGTHVEQGQVIGLVGMTGLATAPHLHYEFHVNGTAVNPLANMNVAMTEPLSKQEKMEFKNMSTSLVGQLQQFANNHATTKNQQLALSDNPQSEQRH